MTIHDLLADYRSGKRTPAGVVGEIFEKIRTGGERPVWISVREESDVLQEVASLDPSLPLWGIPFAVKDNIDVEGLATTAGCPAFMRTPDRSAPVVERLRSAGAVVIGKTNMDQFATGLVGTRTPYGVCSSVFNSDYVSGGSSSGSAVAVAQGLVAFSLGTDTAGSGRVPAAFNNLVGLKPTRGLLSTEGVFPACRSLDCVSIFANDLEDATLVLRQAMGAVAGEPWSRPFSPPRARAGIIRIGIPRAEQLEFFGDPDAARIFDGAVERFRESGCEIMEVDVSDFLAAAKLLYEGAWVAERDHAFGGFLREHPGEVDPTVLQIVTGAPARSAVDAFDGFYRLEELRARTAPLWNEMDALLVPTTPTIHRIADVQADPVWLNARLGTYTNFVNLLDLCALAVPAGFRADGLPLGVTLVGPAFHDFRLAAIAGGVSRRDGIVPIAVVGAHLEGQPLNTQLTDRGAVLARRTITAPCYRLHALETVPPKPGLARVAAGGGSIEVEVWEMPVENFGSFVALVPPPLAIGSLELADGTWVKGFVCEPAPLADAPDITAFGGWRAYLSSR